MFSDTIDTLHGEDVDALCRPELVDRIDAITELEGALAAYKARVVRAIDALDDSGLDGRGVLRSHGRVSSRAASKTAATAHGLADLPVAAESLAAGRITVEHADTLARAAEQVDAETVDAELVELAETAPADLFAKRTREWVTSHTAVPEPDRVHERRMVRRWNDTDTGLRMFLLGLDPRVADPIDAELDRLEQRFYTDDGGRNGDPAVMRTRDQRLADAMVELLTGERRSADTPPHPKHAVTVIYDIAGHTTADGTPLATLVKDGQPLPAAVLEQICCDAVITPVLFDGPARPIWVGRDHRHATIAQWRALIARDRGCVGCGANPNRCQAHHILFWEHFGPTDIDNLVLVCSRCHHDIHNRGHTLHRVKGRWTIRPPGSPPNGKPGRKPDSDVQATPHTGRLTLTA